MKRLVALDTETTGLNAKGGDRIVEIGCVELVDMRKGKTLQWYINPERDIPEEASRIHGITNEKVADAPKFKEVAKEFLNFIADAHLVIHNAAFDMGFINEELKRIKRRPLDNNRVIDTIPMARRKFPGSSVSLDALCKRFKIDNTHRTFHGALLDAELLADVYVELTGGNQFQLDLSTDTDEVMEKKIERKTTHKEILQAREWALTELERETHLAYMEFLQEQSGHCIWLKGGVT